MGLTGKAYGKDPRSLGLWWTELCSDLKLKSEFTKN